MAHRYHPITLAHPRLRRPHAGMTISAQSLRDKPAGPGDDFWYGPAYATGGPVRVTPDTALQVSTVFACVRVLAETVGSLPLNLYRRQVRGGKERADDHRLFPVLHDRPNNWQTSLDWRTQLQGILSLR